MRYRLPISVSLGVALLAAQLGGCVYYNGMYNANRLARSARKAEREGRTFEANNLWGQVATKAESVLVRHPTSKYAHQAGVLRGVALARLGQCEQAMSSLAQISMAATPSELSEDALLSAGRCQLALGNPEAAGAAFGQLLDSKNSDRRREARFQYARLLREQGRYQEALRSLDDQRDPRASTERVLALVGANRLPEALALTDSLITRHDTTIAWDSLVGVLSNQNSRAASSLVDRVGPVLKHSPPAYARVLLEDGIRLSPFDSARAARRFQQAVAIGGPSDAAGRASMALVKMKLSRLSGPEQLPPVQEELKRLAVKYPLVAQELTGLGVTIGSVHQAASPTAPDSLHGDMRLFLAAEVSRDSLNAPLLAERLFRRIIEQWPTSSYAPKAVLAVQQLNPGWLDSAWVLLEERYYDSPYLALIRGEESPRYRELEDSLGAFAASLAGSTAGPTKRRTPRAPVGPGARRRPTPGGSRVPEP
jgi:tetratricopeptide (TPR) repeat protein